MDFFTRRLRYGYQLSYTTPHQINQTVVYPRHSPNGSIIVLYAHDQGVRIVWYAGRPFKTTSVHSSHPVTNGAPKNDPLVIDLDDDDDEADLNSSKPELSAAEFEEEEEEIDPQRPYRKVLRYLDIPASSSVLKLAVPQLQTEDSSSNDSEPPILTSHMVIAAAGEDCSIHLLLLPLSPPRPDQTVAALSNVQRIKINAIFAHQELVESLAIQFSASEELLTDDGDDNPDTSAVEGVALWSLLVASVSAASMGQLLIHRVPFRAFGNLSVDPKHHMPYQRQSLQSGVDGARISFNPSQYPSDRHSSLLIALRDAARVKIYQVIPPKSRIRERRGSTATTGSESSDIRIASGQAGRFAISLLPSFSNEEGSVIGARRKHILDACWILGGRAIIALLEDGEWGVWDLEAIGPVHSSGSKSNLVQGQTNISGLQGGAVSQFSVKGNLTSSSAIPRKSTSRKSPNADALAPTTPHARKIRTEGLFHEKTPELNRHDGELSRGFICIAEQVHSRSTDNTVMFSFNNTNHIISSLQQFWRAESSNQGISTKPAPLPTLSTGGETPHSLVMLPSTSTTGRYDPLDELKVAQRDYLIASDHHVTMFVTPLAEEQDDDSADVSAIGRALQGSHTVDQALLNQGDLDVDGMDRILEGMNGTSTKQGFGKSVGFRIEEDDQDVATASPTPIRSFRSRMPKPTGTPRRIFT